MTEEELAKHDSKTLLQLLLSADARCDALTAQLESTLKDRAAIIAERDRTFALILARAEKAEAERDKYESAWMTAEGKLADIEAERDRLREALEELDFLRHEGGPDSVAAMEADRDRLQKALTDAGAYIDKGQDKMAFNIIRAALKGDKAMSDKYTDLLDDADRIEALTAERDAAYARGYSDAETEISKSALGQRNDFLHSQYANAADHIKVLTAERDRLREALRDGRRLLAIAQDDRIRLLIQLEQCEDHNE